MERYAIRDRAAMQVELSRLRRIEAKADRGIREAIARRIQELQSNFEKSGESAKAKTHAA